MIDPNITAVSDLLSQALDKVKMLESRSLMVQVKGRIEAILFSLNKVAVKAEISVAIPRDQWPVAANLVAKFAKPEDTGIGDVIQRGAALVGGEQFKVAAKALGIDCKCKDRQKWLNDRYPLK